MSDKETFPCLCGVELTGCEEHKCERIRVYKIPFEIAVAAIIKHPDLNCYSRERSGINFSFWGLFKNFHLSQRCWKSLSCFHSIQFPNETKETKKNIKKSWELIEKMIKSELMELKE